MDVQHRYHWQAHDYTGWKLLAVALASFAPCIVCPCSAVVVPAVVMFAFAFFEQRARQHVLPVFLSTIAALLGLWPHDDGLGLAMLVYPPVVLFVYGPLLLLPALVGSMCGLPVSRSRYTIIIGRRGHCPGCGYCLTGLPEQVCPECGRAFELEEVGMGEEAKSGPDDGDVEGKRS